MAQLPSLRWRSRGFRAGYDGRLQAVVDGSAVGWAWDQRNPSKRVEVAIEVEGEVVVHGIADIFRDELLAAEIGDGAHGFLLRLPDSLQSRDNVGLVAVAGPTAFALPDSPSFWQSATPQGPWSDVRFRSGRAATSPQELDTSLEVPPAPQPVPVSALVGVDDWLFDARDLETLREPDDHTLDRVVGELLRIARMCAALDVAYVPALVPDKLHAAIEGSPLAPGPRMAWANKLRLSVRDIDEVELLDLLPVLDDARRHGPCFHRSDPGWNDRGAFFVARALIKEATKRAPNLASVPLTRLHLRDRPGYRGPLADLPTWRLTDGRYEMYEFTFSEEVAVELDAAQLHAERMPVERHLLGGGSHVRLHVKRDGAESPRLSVVGDAASLPVLPWLAESAERTTFFWASTPPMEPVELELPDALLHLIGYRDLAELGVAQASRP